jgi:hypothetical protein
MREAKRQGGGLRTDLGRVGGAGDEVWTIRRAVANRDQSARPHQGNACPMPTPRPCATAVKERDRLQRNGPTRTELRR